MVFTTCIVIVFADCFFFVILLVINENRNQVSFYIPDHNASLYLKLFSRLTMFHLYFLIMIDMALLIPSNVCLFVQYKHRHFFISFFLVYTQLYNVEIEYVYNVSFGPSNCDGFDTSSK